MIFSQQNIKTTYLVVRMNEDQLDNLFKKKFVRIIADGGNQYAIDIYSLRLFDPSKKAINGEYKYYDGKNDTVASAGLYNYFENTTQALMFIAGKGWELISVVSEVSSSYKFERDPAGQLTIIPTITSTPVYYFKKVINN
jgi:hypothetical protein